MAPTLHRPTTSLFSEIARDYTRTHAEVMELARLRGAAHEMVAQLLDGKTLQGGHRDIILEHAGQTVCAFVQAESPETDAVAEMHMGMLRDWLLSTSQIFEEDVQRVQNELIGLTNEFKQSIAAQRAQSGEHGVRRFAATVLPLRGKIGDVSRTV